MSVMAFNEKVSLPIASQSFFSNYWRPAIEQMNLPLLAPLVHDAHIEVTGENWQQFAQELQIVQQWAQQVLTPPNSNFIIGRAQDVLNVLPEVFSNPEAKLVVAT